jgi:hypothetical protein
MSYKTSLQHAEHIPKSNLPPLIPADAPGGGETTCKIEVRIVELTLPHHSRIIEDPRWLMLDC